MPPILRSCLRPVGVSRGLIFFEDTRQHRYSALQFSNLTETGDVGPLRTSICYLWVYTSIRTGSLPAAFPNQRLMKGAP